MDIGLKNEFKTCHSSGLSSILFSGELGFISIIVFNGGVFYIILSSRLTFLKLQSLEIRHLY